MKNMKEPLIGKGVSRTGSSVVFMYFMIFMVEKELT
jgi:hypothetical protein